LKFEKLGKIKEIIPGHTWCCFCCFQFIYFFWKMVFLQNDLSHAWQSKNYFIQLFQNLY